MRRISIIYISLLTSLFCLCGCGSKKSTELYQSSKDAKVQTSKKQIYVSPELNRWNDKQTVKLLPHQLAPIEYLESNPKIKGLLLYHYLGTGKTYTALGYIQRNPDMQVVILAPRFLSSHWQQHIKDFNVINSDRITIVTHENPDDLLKINLSNSILIIDESHRIIEKINSGVSLDERKYSNLYLHLNSAKKVLSLTGTPIYGKLNDIAYQINLVSGKDDIPFNEAEFKSTFLKIKPAVSFVRGHMLESVFLPMASGATTLGLTLAISSNPYAILTAGLGGSFIPGLVKSSFPLETTNMRDFSPSPLIAAIEKYVSYYDFNNPDKSHFPSSTIYIESVYYQKPQIDFLFDFMDSRLSVENVQIMLKDEPGTTSNKLVYLNSTNIQNNLNRKPSAGQQIANMSFANPNKPQQMLYPNKFRSILKKINTKPGPAVLYSHYYYNGIKLFAQYLDDNGKKGNYAILYPDMSDAEHKRIIDRYNKGLIEILLIHPEITEGISLKGTRQMHLLEMPLNKAFQEQVVGRVVRYKSHAHLPVNQQHVDVYIWKAALPRFGLTNNIALRENWDNYFSELNYYSEFGQGRVQIDPNASRKNISPDELAYTQLMRLDNNMSKLKIYLNKYSIENTYKWGAK